MNLTNSWQHYLDQPEYREEFWTLEETCCHSKYSGESSANAGVKNSQKSIILSTGSY